MFRKKLFGMQVGILIVLTVMIAGCPKKDDSRNGGGSGNANELCGNGVVDSGEECDGSELGGHTCTEFGYSGGQISCTPACKLTFRDCDGILDTCGNGSLEPGEECDDGNDSECDGCSACRISEFRVNTSTEGDQRFAKVAMNSSGRFVVVWQDMNQEGEGQAIYGQLYDSDGAPVGGEFQINTTTRYRQHNPAVAMAADGHFVVVWESGDDEGTWEDVYARIFDSDANPVGDEFMVNSSTEDDQSYPGIAMDDDGNFVVVWQSYQEDINTYGAYGQRYDVQGNRIGEEFQLDTRGIYSAWFPKVVMTSNGRFMAVWVRDSEDGSGMGIYAKSYDREGNPVFEAFLLGRTSDDEYLEPFVAMQPDGSFVLIWTVTVGYGEGIGIYGQKFTSDGIRDGEKFTVAVSPDWVNQLASGVAMDSDGSFVVVWYRKVENGSMNGGDVYGQRFASDGIRDGSEFRINTCSGEREAAGPVAMAPDGRFVVVGGRYLMGDDGWDIFAQRFDADGNAVGILPW